ncbi:YlxR family protein [Nocardia brasiliensis]|uniref:YlxR family protein n=1 Tax=Nocardia brasiliensis TaxID=37326 RepID=UPI001D0049A4|nr:YlxR family protein [Nocardia brasiliensis]
MVTSAGERFGDPTGAAVEWTEVQHAQPIRTCIGCRKRELAADLLRIVARKSDTGDGAPAVMIVPDPRRRLPGRGAWLHPVSACLNAAERRRAFGRALRVSGNLDISALEQYLENRHEHS